ncbi:hypothetical protein AGMMS49579_03710 [Spirochaetia bacterium]|nr:hypothetical protein AGMMS49579_03710 [Spirochaetia bacterium]
MFKVEQFNNCQPQSCRCFNKSILFSKGEAKKNATTNVTTTAYFTPGVVLYKGLKIVGIGFSTVPNNSLSNQSLNLYLCNKKIKTAICTKMASQTFVYTELPEPIVLSYECNLIISTEDVVEGDSAVSIIIE